MIKSKKEIIHYSWIILLSSFITVLGAHGFGRFAYSLILRDMKIALNLDYFQMGLIATANFIGYLALATIGGALASKYGSRIIIVSSTIAMGISMILTGMANSFIELIIYRFITGLGNGGAYLPAMALPSIWFALKYRGRATGVVTAGIGVGFASTGIIIPMLVSGYGDDGWRYTWIILGVALLVISILDYLVIRDRPEDIGTKPYGAEDEETIATNKVDNGLKWGEVYRSGNIWYVGIVFFMYGLSYIIYITFFSAYLEDIFLWGKTLIGELWFTLGILSIFSGIIWGWISDKLGRKYAICMAYTTLATSYLLFAAAIYPYGLYLSPIIFGIAAWSIPTLAIVTAADYVSPELRSAAAGFVTLFFGIGQVIGPSIGGYIINTTKNFAAAFYISFAISLLGAALALFLKKPRY